MYVFKVVRKVDSNYYSYAEALPHQFETEYKIGEWTLPPSNQHPYDRLYGFETMDNVLNFLKIDFSFRNLDTYLHRIFVAEIIPADRPYLVTYADFVGKSKEFIESSNLWRLNVPEGTVACKAIKLLKEI